MIDSTMRRALVVGIDAYPQNPLKGCVNDARKILQALRRNEDGSPNFDCRYLLAPDDSIDKDVLTTAIEELLAAEADVAALYYSGHGAIEGAGGYLVTPEVQGYAEVCFKI